MQDIKLQKQNSFETPQPVDDFPVIFNPNMHEEYQKQLKYQKTMQGKYSAYENDIVQKVQGDYRCNANGCTDPVTVQCPTCHTIGKTRAQQNSCNIVSGMWCMVGMFCCLIPGCCQKQTETNHFCTTCNSNVGTKSPECL